MEISKQIVTMLNLKFCSSFELEFVDERKTSLKTKNFNQGGKQDMLSAKYISQRDGLQIHDFAFVHNRIIPYFIITNLP